MHHANPYDQRGHVYGVMPYADPAAPPPPPSPTAKLAPPPTASPAMLALLEAQTAIVALLKQILAALEEQRIVYGEPMTGRYPQVATAKERIVTAGPRALTILFTAGVADCVFAFTQAAIASATATFVVPAGVTFNFELPPGKDLWVSSTVARAASVAVLPHVRG